MIISQKNKSRVRGQLLTGGVVYTSVDRVSQSTSLVLLSLNYKGNPSSSLHLHCHHTNPDHGLLSSDLPALLPPTRIAGYQMFIFKNNYLIMTLLSTGSCGGVKFCGSLKNLGDPL